MQPRQKQNTNACMITSGVFSAKVSVPGATVLRTRGATKSVSSHSTLAADLNDLDSILSILSDCQMPGLASARATRTQRQAPGCRGWGDGRPWLQPGRLPEWTGEKPP